MQRSGIRGSVIPGIDRPFYVPIGPDNCSVGFFKRFRLFALAQAVVWWWLATGVLPDSAALHPGYVWFSRIPLRCIQATFGFLFPGLVGAGHGLVCRHRCVSAHAEQNDVAWRQRSAIRVAITPRIGPRPYRWPSRAQQCLAGCICAGMSRASLRAARPGRA